MGSESVLAENPVSNCIEPVGQGRLLEVANAIELHGDPVAALEHVLGHLRVRSVYIVKQRWSKERGELDGKKGRQQQSPDGEPRRGKDESIWRTLCHGHAVKF